jgi:hypothetical protein
MAVRNLCRERLSDDELAACCGFGRRLGHLLHRGARRDRRDAGQNSGAGQHAATAATPVQLHRARTFARRQRRRPETFKSHGESVSIGEILGAIWQMYRATMEHRSRTSFVVDGATQAHDAALTTASAEMKFIGGLSLAATFEGEFSDVTDSYAGEGVVRYAW